MKISINEPCHEDWDKMTPNDRGAFCLACQKTVVDFSRKTIDEIKIFFIQKPATESVCGRFRKNQMHELSFDEFITEFMSWKFLKRAAVICFLVLGTTLFSSCSPDDRGEEVHTAGMVAFDSSATIKPVKDTLKTQSYIDHNNFSADTLKKEKPKKEKKKKVKKDPPEKFFLKGDVAVN